MAGPDAMWECALAQIIDDAHLAPDDRLPAVLDDAVRPLGLSAELLVVDLAQRALHPLRRPAPEPAHEVDGTLAGRAYQLGEMLAGHDEDDRPVLWVPMLDGTERVGVLRVATAAGSLDEAELRRCGTLAGLMGHVLMTKMAYGDGLRRLRGDGPMTAAAELLWRLLPPRTCSTEQVVVTALLEPYDRVAGDAYDYAVDSESVDVAVYDGVGHDVGSGLTTALAVTAVRGARRDGETDLVAVAERADALLAAQSGPTRFVTAVLARLDVRTGVLSYLLAGHPAPLLLRDGHVVKELAAVPRPPLGVLVDGAADAKVATEALEPGDRLLLYTDGIVEARDEHGEFFGERRLADFTERAEADRLSAPETLRRLTAAVLRHQGGQLQDDATLVLVDWSGGGHESLLPSR